MVSMDDQNMLCSHSLERYQYQWTHKIEGS